MIDFESSDELEIGVDDVLEIVTEIRRDDVVVIERTSLGNFAMRALDEMETEGYDGRKYLIDKGRMPGTVKMSLV